MKRDDEETGTGQPSAQRIRDALVEVALARKLQAEERWAGSDVVVLCRNGGETRSRSGGQIVPLPSNEASRGRLTGKKVG